MTIFVAAGLTIPTTNAGAAALGWVDAQKQYGATGNGSTDDTSALQAAINATPAGGTLYLAPGTYKVSSTLTVSSAISIIGSGVTPLYGSQSIDFKTVDVPFVSPYLAGCVINMVTAATDVIQLTQAGVACHLREFGVTFGTSIKFTNTGHGIFATPPASGSYQDNGIMSSRWSNIPVYGHDGNHYAYKIINPLYCTFEGLHSWGGGGLYLETYATTGHYGNSLFEHSYHQVIAGGSAHGIVTTGQNNVMNLVTFIRPQVTVQDIGSAERTTLGIGAAPTSSQYLVTTSNTDNISFIGEDFESNVSSTVFLTGITGWNMDKAGLYPAGTSTGSAGWL